MSLQQLPFTLTFKEALPTIRRSATDAIGQFFTERCARLIKQDLIQRIVERTGLPRNKAEAAVDAIFGAMKNALATGDRIELRGFGVFTVKPRKTGVGRNPRTGTKVDITPGRAVRFKPGKELQSLE